MTKLIDIEINNDKDFRKKALMNFKELGIPNSKSEYWKYTKPKDLNVENYVLEDNSSYDANQKYSSEMNIDAYKIEFFNGKLINIDEDLKNKIDIQNNEIKSLQNWEIKHPFTSLNNALCNSGISILIKKNMIIEKPIIIVYKTFVNDVNLLSNIRNSIILEDNANATVVEHFVHAGDLKSVYFNNVVNEIKIGKNAILNHYKFQHEAFKANHIAYNYVQVFKDGLYESVLFQKGANLSRCESFVQLREDNATANLDCLYKISGWATIDTTTEIEHLHKRTFSNQLVKGVIDGDAKGIFQGKIHIAKDAIHVIGNQMHKALLLSDKAEVDCKPELEIFADDVKCSHGATSGVLDEDMLFYMRSRGIDENIARNILIDAYLDEVISRIKIIDIYNWTKSFVD